VSQPLIVYVRYKRRLLTLWPFDAITSVNRIQKEVLHGYVSNNHLRASDHEWS
jgi:hypothetical protein